MDEQGYPLDEFVSDINEVIDSASSRGELKDALQEISDTIKSSLNDD